MASALWLSSGQFVSLSLSIWLDALYVIITNVCDTATLTSLPPFRLPPTLPPFHLSSHPPFFPPSVLPISLCRPIPTLPPPPPAGHARGMGKVATELRNQCSREEEESTGCRQGLRVLHYKPVGSHGWRDKVHDISEIW